MKNGKERVCSSNYSVEGEPSDFYVFSKALGKPSGWVKGNSSAFHALRNALRNNKKAFDKACSNYF